VVGVVKEILEILYGIESSLSISSKTVIYHWFCLALNPEHPETRGLLKDYWNTVKENKYSLLKILMEGYAKRYRR
jgi:hypothetical protein